MFIAYTFFQHKLIHKYTWKSRDESEQKSVIVQTAVKDKSRKDALDATVVRIMFDRS